MSAEAIWSAFAETGEPALYLLYRAAEEERRRKDRFRSHAAAE